MNHYELLCILSGKIADNAIGTLEKEIEDLIKNNAATLHYTHHMDRKRLAYPINHHHYGTYFLAEFDASAEKVASLDAQLKLNADVLRHALSVRATVGAPPTIERKQSFDALPDIAEEKEIERSSVQSPIIKPIVEHTLPPLPESLEAPLSSQKEEPVVNTEEVSSDATAKPVAKKKQEKLSYEELDKKLDEIINNDLF